MPASASKVTSSFYALSGLGAAAPGPRNLQSRTMAIQYLRSAPIVVRGSVTGRRYAFSGGNPVQAVDAHDAATLLRTSLFRRA
jgi:hypothetical protein